MQLTYDETVGVLDIKYFTSERTWYTLTPGIYEIGDINKTLEYLWPDFVKVNITIDNIGLRSNLNINQTLKFTKKSFFYKKSGLIQSHSGSLGDIEGSI